MSTINTVQFENVHTSVLIFFKAILYCDAAYTCLKRVLISSRKLTEFIFLIQECFVSARVLSELKIVTNYSHVLFS